ncbi:5-formyltetrahydrofolate cyclo-ligase [Leucobacter sp. W1153]|uniref:5-formyltetrahydrofolate cyclo-ligase n=1 Tax=Leucobacter sp. W1153 TaxID=3439064 RepID=UPI003F3A1506
MRDSVDNAKRRIRQEIRAERLARSPGDQKFAAAALAEQLATLVTDRLARSVTCYLPVAGEPDTADFLAWARAHDIDVLLPAAREDGLLDWIRPLAEGTVTGAYGIPEPLGEHLSPLAASEVDLMLIPACAVDHRGVRLGWGKGYFDRNLSALRKRPPVFAIVHDSEFVAELPSEAHDVPVNGVVTPHRTSYFDQSDPRISG